MFYAFSFPSQNQQFTLLHFFIQQVIVVVHSNISVWLQFLDSIILITNFPIENIQLVRNVLSTSIAVVFILTKSSLRFTLIIKKAHKSMSISF